MALWNTLALSAVLAVPAAAAPSASDAISAAERDAAAAITPALLRAHVQFLASDISCGSFGDGDV
jgi:hypothetical protein